MTFDFTIRHGTVVNADGAASVDIGVRDGVIAAMEPGLPVGLRDIDARGRFVLPGGVDSHCHVEQLSGMGLMCADDFYSATVSAAFGGNTTIIPFGAQHRGNALPEVIADYSRRAAEKAVIDYGFHLILANPDEQTLRVDLPQAIRDGITSFKVFMTYDALKLDDFQMLDVLDVARTEGALVMVHAENHDMIRWLAQRLVERGHKAPKYHAVAHTPLAEAEATYRAIALSQLAGTPLMIVHVSTPEAIRTIAAAQALGVPIYGETCPQYLFLTAEDIDQPGMEGAKFCCSPPPRDGVAQDALWEALKTGVLRMYSSDHAPYRFDETGKLPHGNKTSFKQMANGVPGLEARLPLLFSAGVNTGRMTMEQFVDVSATQHARTYGLYPRKGVLAVGSDADIAVWNATREVTLSASMLHDRVGYTPYEGRTVTGWPEIVVSRGRVVVEDNALHVEAGSGAYLRRGTPEPVLAASSGSGWMMGASAHAFGTYRDEA
ncbi:dihydropyrimidinase [Caballeronia sp. GAFFF2]|uniref:dihydropyrimidinase n=1 Tax=Caballeronia sp. GAFFF2 TaxID=2921741 RepID=UPI0020278160|nr:dihydropyrimidinase [Caballeronia sp. GAFFF2]